MRKPITMLYDVRVIMPKEICPADWDSNIILCSVCATSPLEAIKIAERRIDRAEWLEVTNYLPF